MTDEVTVEVALLDAKTGEPTTYVLYPKLSAMRILNRYAGGYAGMFRALQNFDVDAMATVIIAGTGATGNPAKVIEERAYRTGAEDLLKPLVRFVNICAAGGRDPDAVEDTVKAGAADTGNG
jgi:hypothetical protein